MSATFLLASAARQLMCATFPNKVAQSSVRLMQFFLGATFFSFKVFRTAILKENFPMNVPYFIKENLQMSASDAATLKKIFGGSKPSSKLTLKTKW